ncbi:MAG TPA: N-acetylmuramoyl-L-alanine amidase-like domain-containing protein [Blastocatellia bacterium]|nr:N-acetylmuramoyl-L-alanine amidase-like domain-containing protein [Blastocatellia bacterium]
MSERPKALNIPSRLDPDFANDLLEKVREIDDLPQRLDRISAEILGSAYQEGSLGGGPALAEEFRIDLKVFDCVTLIEVALALTLADSVPDFIDMTRRIRYDDGRISWIHRNHYMVDWARNNERSGFIRNVTSGPLAAEKTCTLNLIEGLEARTTKFKYFPAEELVAANRVMDDGDIILFVSTRNDLDVFHTGIVFERDGRMIMRHATRRAGLVIDQDLDEFVGQNQLSGIVVLRPICQC